jgi:hypothetical protein
VWFFLFLILVFGFRPLRSVMAVAPLVCRRCGVRAEQRVIRRSLRLTLFFIPVLPLSTAYLLQCSNCAAETRVTEDQAQRSVEWARSHPVG